MDKPKLFYVTYYDKGPLAGAEIIEKYVLNPLVTNKLINFIDDSEVFDLTNFSGTKLIASMLSVDSNGEVTSKYVNMKGSVEEDRNDNYIKSFYTSRGIDTIIERTRNHYRAEIEKGTEIYLKLEAQEGQKIGSAENQFPSEEQRNQLRKTLETYLSANPGNYPRLVVLSGSKEYAELITKTFIEIASEVAELKEIKLL